jgi:hypothetical protein
MPYCLKKHTAPDLRRASNEQEWKRPRPPVYYEKDNK